ncbi:hypothetical protein [Laspinema olomoucense]|nr:MULTISPECIES: hypothetical protein [unclassified Laspinema]
MALQFTFPSRHLSDELFSPPFRDFPLLESGDRIAISLATPICWS